MSAIVKAQPSGQEVATAEAPATSVLQVIERAARDPAIDIDKLERLLNMQERIVMRDAEAQFNSAMTDSQAQIGRIAADAVNPQTRSKYATYAKLDSILRPIYTRNGFSLSFTTADSPRESFVRVVAHVAHRAGFSRDYMIDMPADGKGAKGGDVMTKTHAVGAGVSYGMRYLLKAIFNVAIGEDDIDGNEPTQRNEKAVPEGYDKWKADMTVKADEGTASLQAAWQKSAADLRVYATMADSGWWSQTKAKAARVSKQESGA